MARFLSAYGMLAVLALLCAFFAVATLHEEYPAGRDAGERLGAAIAASRARPRRVAIVHAPGGDGPAFAAALERRLTAAGFRDLAWVEGDPPGVRRSMEQLAAAGGAPDLVATTPSCADWAVWDSLRKGVPSYAGLQVRSPAPERRSTFLSASNLRNVADQMAVIAIIAVGMTMVIITGGIDLSVGSLVALSAVAVAWLIRRSGGEAAGWAAMLGACLASVAACGLVGLFSGLTITRFRVPPFIATLAMMQVASGLAFILAQGQSIYDIPASFTWLGRGESLAGIPNAVVLMLLLYAAAHFFMTRTAAGRHVYAVGGSSEAARLSGVSTWRTLLLVYLVSGLMAGVGGVITASQLKAGAPTYGLMYELYVIAAVVVGGTSLSGGEGRIFGTLIGALIIGVIRNGMNLTDVEPYTQKVVLGLVILGAVLLDMLKQKRWARV